jgi:hypothetical protein
MLTLEDPVPSTPLHLKHSHSTLVTNLSSNMIRQRPVIIDFMSLNTNTEGTGAVMIFFQGGAARKFAYRLHLSNVRFGVAVYTRAYHSLCACLYSYTLKMEAIRSSETSVLIRATQRHLPEDDNHHSTFKQFVTILY